MRLNTAVKKPHGTTHEGASAAPMTPEQALRRSVLSCLLWESEFYEDGQEIAARIIELAGRVDPDIVADLAVEARTSGNLRHVPLLLLSALARRKGHKLAPVIAKVIQRADELSELLAVHASLHGVKPSEVKKTVSAQMKKGLAAAFGKFGEYQLAKYNRDSAIKLRDVLFLAHPKPRDAEQSALWKRLANNELAVPDTWEVQLSKGADKRETFERLIAEGHLGYLALLRNLRNMIAAGCDSNLVRGAIVARRGAERVLPFRYVAAAKAAPQFEPALDQALSFAIDALPVLPGKTIVLVDVSGSMDGQLSAKSDMTRMVAGAALASMIHGDVRVFTFSDTLGEVPPRRGMAGVDAIVRSQPHGGTHLGKAITHLNRPAFACDRLIVVTDEQSHDAVPQPAAPRAYMINVASAQRGVGYGRWVHIDGFSESVLRFIHEHESQR